MLNIAQAIDLLFLYTYLLKSGGLKALYRRNACIAVMQYMYTCTLVLVVQYIIYS